MIFFLFFKTLIFFFSLFHFIFFFSRKDHRNFFLVNLFELFRLLLITMIDGGMQMRFKPILQRSSTNSAWDYQLPKKRWRSIFHVERLAAELKKWFPCLVTRNENFAYEKFLTHLNKFNKETLLIKIGNDV